MMCVSPRQGKRIWAARTAPRKPTALPDAHIPLLPPHGRPSFRSERGERRNPGVAMARRKGQSLSADSGGVAGGMSGGVSLVIV